MLEQYDLPFVISINPVGSSYACAVHSAAFSSTHTLQLLLLSGFLVVEFGIAASQLVRWNKNGRLIDEEVPIRHDRFAEWNPNGLLPQPIRYPERMFSTVPRHDGRLEATFVLPQDFRDFNPLLSTPTNVAFVWNVFARSGGLSEVASFILCQ